MEKPAEKIIFIRNNTPVWVMFLVLSLLSSCNIRKGIQAGLNIPVTKQLNPSKTTGTPDSSCFISEGEVYAFPASKTDSSSGTALFHFRCFSVPAYQLVTIKVNTVQGWPLSLKVEPYILFRQLKSWISS